jgi:hypothetical protein
VDSSWIVKDNARAFAAEAGLERLTGAPKWPETNAVRPDSLLEGRRYSGYLWDRTLTGGVP